MQIKHISGAFGCLTIVGCVFLACPAMAQNSSNTIIRTPAANARVYFPAAPVNQAAGNQQAVRSVPFSDPILSIKPRVTNPLPVVEEDDFYTLYLELKLEVGTRLTQFVLLNSHRGDRFYGSFVGSITRLKENQDYLPSKLFVQYKFHPNIGVGLGYDSLSAAAWDDEGTDGDCEISGPLLYLLGSYPNETKFTPFCELGLAFYSAKFDKSPNWGHLPGKEFILDNTTGFYLAAGCDLLVSEYVSVDFYLRYMHVDVNGVFTHPVNSDEDIIFTMSNLVFGLGTKVTF